MRKTTSKRKVKPRPPGPRVKTPRGKVRLAIDFPSMDAMRTWFTDIRATGALPSDAAVYAQDGLDTTTVGVTPANTFVVRRGGDRPYPPVVKALDYDPEDQYGGGKPGVQ